MKYGVILSVIWLLYAIGNIAIAEWNVAIVKKRQAANDSRQINHPLWAFGYTIICMFHYLLFKDWLFCISLLLLHLSVFPVAFNIIKGQPAYFLSKTTNALTDKIMIKIGLSSTECVNLGALALSIIFLIISFF